MNGSLHFTKRLYLTFSCLDILCHSRGLGVAHCFSLSDDVYSHLYLVVDLGLPSPPCFSLL